MEPSELDEPGAARGHCLRPEEESALLRGSAAAGGAGGGCGGTGGGSGSADGSAQVKVEREACGGGTAAVDGGGMAAVGGQAGKRRRLNADGGEWSSSI